MPTPRICLPSSWRLMACLSLLAGLGVPASAASFLTGAAVETGVSEASYCSLTLARVALQHAREGAWYRGESWQGTSYWDFSLGRWDNHSLHPTNAQDLDLGVTPVFRFERMGTGPVAPYVEAAVGIHLLSHTSVSMHRTFGSPLAFGDHIGVGLLLGTDRTYELGYRFQHISNGGAFPPNMGINYHVLRFGMHF
ncbi:MAG TPA: acyloxyacyl hydrolase [Holophaga sp.]|nr:acyloxyacyl hydrolase [Holophaga sp.]